MRDIRILTPGFYTESRAGSIWLLILAEWFGLGSHFGKKCWLSLHFQKRHVHLFGTKWEFKFHVFVDISKMFKWPYLQFPRIQNSKSQQIRKCITVVRILKRKLKVSTRIQVDACRPSTRIRVDACRPSATQFPKLPCSLNFGHFPKMVSSLNVPGSL